MVAAIEQFRRDISRIRNIQAIYSYLRSNSQSALDLDDLLRNQIVMSVSALDLLVHEMIRLGMIDCFQGRRPRTDQFNKYGISLENVSQALSNPLLIEWLDSEIRSKHKVKTFQSPDNISAGIKLISQVTLWDNVSSLLSESKSDTKKRLELIVDRRNKIAHESDCTPTVPIGRWAIDEVITKDVVDYIERLGEAIYRVVI